MASKSQLFTMVVCGVVALAGCGSREQSGSESAAAKLESPESFQEQLQIQLLDAKPGDVINIPKGKFQFDRPLSLNADGVTIRGAGMEQSILSFKGQKVGAEGLIVHANDFTAEGFAIEDTKGDGLKVNEGENIVLRNLRIEWTNGPATENGAYGLYPVQTKNVLVEGSVVIASSDAGIYVGQSENIIVRNNRAEYNVAGIEIENSINADVYDNVAVNNTGGILVFNMPHIPLTGHSTRVFNNKVHNNNTWNFGRPGTAVAGIPAGSGILVNSNDKVEIFGNDIRNNNTANVIVSSGYDEGYLPEEASGSVFEEFDRFAEGIYIHNNTYEGGGTAPGFEEFEALRVAVFGEDGHLPNVFWDGLQNTEKFVDGALPTEFNLCVSHSEGDVFNLDAANGVANPRIVTAEHLCELESLEPVKLTGPLAHL